MCGWCSRGGPHLLLEVPHGRRVADVAGTDDLKSDDPLHALVFGLVDRAHAALAQQRQDLVTRVAGQFRRNGGRFRKGRRQAASGFREGGIPRADAGRGFRQRKLGLRRGVRRPRHGIGQPGGGRVGKERMVVGGPRSLAAGTPVFRVQRHQFPQQRGSPRLEPIAQIILQTWSSFHPGRLIAVAHPVHAQGQVQGRVGAVRKGGLTHNPVSFSQMSRINFSFRLMERGA